MGKLIREKDWSETPLGPPDQWPQSLRTMVSVMLDNPFGMYIAWGDDFTQLCSSLVMILISRCHSIVYLAVQDSCM